MSGATTDVDVWERIQQAVRDAPPAHEAGGLWKDLAADLDPGAFRP